MFSVRVSVRVRVRLSVRFILRFRHFQVQEIRRSARPHFTRGLHLPAVKSWATGYASTVRTRATGYSQEYFIHIKFIIIHTPVPLSHTTTGLP